MRISNIGIIEIWSRAIIPIIRYWTLINWPDWNNRLIHNIGIRSHRMIHISTFSVVSTMPRALPCCSFRVGWELTIITKWFNRETTRGTNRSVWPTWHWSSMPHSLRWVTRRCTP